MTVEQALQEIGADRLIIMGGRQVFFNTHDPEEAALWIERGATTREFFAGHAVRFSGQAKQGWEIHPLGACERITVTQLTGQVEDVTAQELVAQARSLRAAL